VSQTESHECVTEYHGDGRSYEAEMFEFVEQLMNSLEPLGSKKNAQLACLIGLLAGGIGLAIYFKSIVDLVVPTLFAILLGLVLQDPGSGWFVGAIVSGAYGYFRVASSNKALSRSSALKQTA
jgi:hypothetical protein